MNNKAWLVVNLLLGALLGVVIFGLFTPSAKPSTILYLGDSMIANWPLPPSVTNAGYGGQTCDSVLYNYRTRHWQRWQTVVLWVGTNDIGAHVTPDDYHACIRQLVALFGLDAHVIIIGPPPVAERWQAKFDPARLASERTWLRDFAAATNADFVDAYALLSDYETGAYRAGLSDDGLHAAQHGYDLLDAALREVLAGPWKPTGDTARRGGG